MDATCPFHIIVLDLTTQNTRWSMQVMKIFTQFSSASWHFVTPRLKYSPQHSVLKHPEHSSSLQVMPMKFSECLHFKHTCILIACSQRSPSTPLSSYALCPTMLPLLETFLELLLWSQRGLGIFLFTTASRTALGPTQPPIQWEPGALSLGVKRPGREADHSPSI
jgi:hypothetical protein